MARLHPDGIFEATFPGRAALFRYRPRGDRRPGARPGDRGPLPVPVDAVGLRPPAPRRGHALPGLREARRPRDRPRRRGGRGLRRVGAERPPRERRGRLQRLGRPAAPDAPPSRRRHLGALRSRARRGEPLQVRDPGAGRGAARPEGGSLRLRVRGRGAAHRLGRGLSRRVPLGRRGLDGRARAPERARRAHLDLRGPPGLVAARARGGQPVPHLPGARRGARGLRPRPGLHPRGAPADRRAPLLRVVGLPADRRLRADPPVRDGEGLHGLRGRAPPPRDRRHPRLGAGPLPARLPRSRLLRRHPPLRARGPAPARAGGLGDAGLQLRPPRGRQLPHRQRALLARALPPGRAPGGRGRLDALPRLLEEAGRVAAEPPRGQREPGGDRLHPAVQRGRLPVPPGRDDHRRGVDVVADGLAPHVRRRARLRVQVEHGLDARRPRLHAARSGPPEVPSQPAHVRAALRVARELRAPAVPRRGGPRQGLAPRQDAGRRLAEVRRAPRALRVHVRAPRQEAPLHGRRVRADARVESRCEPRLAPPRPGAVPPRAPEPGPGPEPRVPGGAGAAPGRLRSGGVPVDGLLGRRAERRGLRAARARPSGLRAGRVQLHAGAPARLPGRRAGGGLLPGAAQHRRRLLRGEQPRQRGRRPGGAPAVDRPAVVGDADPPAARRGDAQARAAA